MILPADVDQRFGKRAFRKQEFARLVLKPDEKRSIDEMKTLGTELMVVRLDTKFPFPDRLP